MTVSPADLLRFLQQHSRSPLTVREILSQFPVDKRQRQELQRLLERLAVEGVLVRLKGDRLSLPRQTRVVTGKVSIHRDGYGFVTPEEGEVGDVFIPARFLREAMNGDRVLLRVERGRGGKPEGQVVRVLERAHLTVVGRYESDGRRFGRVVPSDPRLGADLFVPRNAALDARPGELVVARIDVYPAQGRGPQGSVLEVLGDPADPEVEVLSIIHRHGLPHRFPPEVLAEAQQVPQTVGEEECGGREDLRMLPTVTIDGESAKDFDDAVSVRREGKDRIRLWVSIADVGHYVREGSALDREAYERGTSVYFPGRCLPMLPEALSNGICSLNPGVDRLALTAEILFDEEGNRLESRFYPAVIRSQARMTYTQVKAMVVDGDFETINLFPGLLPHMQLMAELAARLTALRRRRGSLDFDLPEAEIILDLRGRPENIIRAERNLAHRLIEEFMLAANEAVATFLAGRGAPFLYRVHEPPDPEKLQLFAEFAAHFGYSLVLQEGRVEPRRLQAMLASVEGKPEERMLNQVLLRSMKQARYTPDNVGHFGLAAELYCHFTSPIRRYPDLVVHRVLTEVLRHGQLPERRKARLEQTLPTAGEQTSQRERRAMEAEREIVELKKCQFMADKVGECYPGIIAGVQPFGFFVELRDLFVEGLVHVTSLGDDYYQFDEQMHRLVGERQRRVFQIGGEVEVRVARVDLERRQIEFVLAEAATPDQRPARSPRRKGR